MATRRKIKARSMMVRSAVIKRSSGQRIKRTKQVAKIFGR